MLSVEEIFYLRAAHEISREFNSDRISSPDYYFRETHYYRTLSLPYVPMKDYYHDYHFHKLPLLLLLQNLMTIIGEEYYVQDLMNIIMLHITEFSNAVFLHSVVFNIRIIYLCMCQIIILLVDS